MKNLPGYNRSVRIGAAPAKLPKAEECCKEMETYASRANRAEVLLLGTFKFCPWCGTPQGSRD